ncbi:MAG TPA: hypothetical protein VEO00_12945 [Actinomycetota bacterium]|nr:hypothetical protein [Actinomycetota bacterium]
MSPEDGGRLEVEWEVDSHVAGQRWNMAIKRAGVLLKSGRRTTDACGDAELRVVVSNAAGTDAFRGKAANLATGETCKGTISF